jgi:hypothetical protein
VAKVSKKAAPKAKVSAKASKVKTIKKPISKVAAKKTPAVKAKKPAGSKRLLNDVKIAKLQKMYKSSKLSAQQLCDEFGISMATLFNYLKVKV